MIINSLTLFFLDLNKMVTGTLPQITQQVTEMHLHMEPRPYVRKGIVNIIFVN